MFEENDYRIFKVLTTYISSRPNAGGRPFSSFLYTLAIENIILV